MNVIGVFPYTCAAPAHRTNHRWHGGLGWRDKRVPTTTHTMTKTTLIAALFAAIALTACGKKEEAPAAAPAPVAAPAPAADAAPAAAPVDAAAPAAAPADAAAAPAADAAAPAAATDAKPEEKKQ